MAARTSVLDCCLYSDADGRLHHSVNAVNGKDLVPDNILSSKIEFRREFYADHNVSDTFDCKHVRLISWGRFLEGGINYTRYNSYSRDKSAILGITIPGIKMGSRKHYLSLE